MVFAPDPLLEYLRILAPILSSARGYFDEFVET
jgi:hypothetical protein